MSTMIANSEGSGRLHVECSPEWLQQRCLALALNCASYILMSGEQGICDQPLASEETMWWTSHAAIDSVRLSTNLLHRYIKLRLSNFESVNL